MKSIESNSEQFQDASGQLSQFNVISPPSMTSSDEKLSAAKHSVSLPSVHSGDPSTFNSKELDFDELLTLIGEFGAFQALVFLVVSLGVLAEALFVLVYVFVVAVPEHWCAVPELNGLNFTTDELMRLTIPVDSDKYSSCRMYSRNYTGWTEQDARNELQEMDKLNGTWNGSEVVKCRSGWNYDRSIYSSTIVTEWDLVCDDEWMSSFAYTMVGIGQLLGAIMWGPITDRFGRKMPYKISMTLMIGFALAVSFSPNYAVYCTFQFLMAVNTVACFALGETMAVELSGVSWRGHISTAVNYFWTFGYMLLAGLAYAVRDWWKLQLIISASSFILLVPIFLLPESPRWLYSQNEREKADDVMRRITKFNKISFPEDVHVTCVSDEPQQECDWSVLNLFRTHRMRIYTVILGFNWFANALCYYGVSLLLPPLTTVDVYLAFFVSGAVELPGYLLAQLTITRAGRKWPLFFTLAIGGVSLLCTWPVPADDPNLSWLALVLSLIGKLCVTASWGIAICFTAELYPTVIRGAGMFVCTLCGNIANALAPQVGLLASFGTFIPFTIFGIIAVSAALLALLLPETLGEHLTDTVKQTERKNLSSREYDATQSTFGGSSEYSITGTQGTYTSHPVDYYNANPCQ